MGPQGIRSSPIPPRFTEMHPTPTWHSPLSPAPASSSATRSWTTCRRPSSPWEGKPHHRPRNLGERGAKRRYMATPGPWIFLRHPRRLRRAGFQDYKALGSNPGSNYLQAIWAWARDLMSVTLHFLTYEMVTVVLPASRGCSKDARR